MLFISAYVCCASSRRMVANRVWRWWSREFTHNSLIVVTRWKEQHKCSDVKKERKKFSRCTVFVRCRCVLSICSSGMVNFSALQLKFDGDIHGNSRFRSKMEIGTLYWNAAWLNWISCRCCSLCFTPICVVVYVLGGERHVVIMFGIEWVVYECEFHCWYYFNGWGRRQQQHHNGWVMFFKFSFSSAINCDCIRYCKNVLQKWQQPASNQNTLNQLNWFDFLPLLLSHTRSHREKH